jgi:hypothetical protein
VPAVQETEDQRKVAVTSVAMIHAMKRIVGRNGRSIKEAGAASVLILVAAHTDTPDRVWGVRRIGPLPYPRPLALDPRDPIW